MRVYRKDTLSTATDLNPPPPKSHSLLITTLLDVTSDTTKVYETRPKPRLYDSASSWFLAPKAKKSTASWILQHSTTTLGGWSSTTIWAKAQIESRLPRKYQRCVKMVYHNSKTYINRPFSIVEIAAPSLIKDRGYWLRDAGLFVGRYFHWYFSLLLK